ncbi:Calcium-dependent secretion activator [Toxocara canis]|uniref:Calcium-dependent secretion activator n=1 Tax=Toxocara canis TaxID=6265 RepID=A0A0B2W2H6_TOXCA|nr:Calcium-dependent secretion activator [Toxocara canis]
MLGASSSEEDDDDRFANDNDDASEILSIPRRQLPTSVSPRSNSPAPSDSVSQANSLNRGDSTRTRRNDSINSGLPTFRSSSSRQLQMQQAVTRPVFAQSSQEMSDDDEEYTSNDQGTPAHIAADSVPKISKEEEERIKAEMEEEERKKKLQLYVFVAKCIAYHFNAKQPTDMARRQMKAYFAFSCFEMIFT